MKIEDIKFIYDHPVYCNVAFEDAELQEFADIFDDMIKSLQKWGQWLYDCLKPFMESIKRFGEEIYKNALGTPKYKTEAIMQTYTPKYYLKNKYRK